MTAALACVELAMRAGAPIAPEELALVQPLAEAAFAIPWLSKLPPLPDAPDLADLALFGTPDLFPVPGWVPRTSAATPPAPALLDPAINARTVTVTLGGETFTAPMKEVVTRSLKELGTEQLLTRAAGIREAPSAAMVESLAAWLNVIEILSVWRVRKASSSASCPVSPTSRALPTRRSRSCRAMPSRTATRPSRSS